jgi:ribosomal protein L44E
MFILTMVVISLAGISIRIQKGNKLQKKSIEQSLVKTDAKYSEFGIFRQGGRTVIKCPSCAEFISIEAKICKNCQSNVEKHVADLTRKMRELDEDQRQFLVEQREISAKERVEQLQKIKKNLPKITLIVVVISGILVGANNFATKKEINDKKNWLIESKNEYQNAITNLADQWDSALMRCEFDGVEVSRYFNMRFDRNRPDIIVQIKLHKTEETFECIRDAQRLLNYTTPIRVFDGEVWREYNTVMNLDYGKYSPGWRDRYYYLTIVWYQRS